MSKTDDYWNRVEKFTNSLRSDVDHCVFACNNLFLFACELNCRREEEATVVSC